MHPGDLMPRKALDRLGAEGFETLIERAQREARDAEPHLCCRACRQRITPAAARCERGGRHRHRCTNPLGHRYTIGCFSAADGCRCLGAAIVEHTWFAGYAWRIALCAGCGAHLGWHYEGAGAAFYGLILDQLVTCGNGLPH